MKSRRIKITALFLAVFTIAFAQSAYNYLNPLSSEDRLQLVMDYYALSFVNTNNAVSIEQAGGDARVLRAKADAFKLAAQMLENR